MRKRLVNAKPGTIAHDLSRLVQRRERKGMSLVHAMRSIAADRGAGHLLRGLAGHLLLWAGDCDITNQLFTGFFAREEKDELWEIALVLEEIGDLRSVSRLIHALDDLNPHRRHAAARALGWIPDAGSRAARALSNTLTDTSQPREVREEAAESLAYLHWPQAIPSLVSALADPDVRIRFLAVFALGSIRNRRTYRHADRRVVPALKAMLTDREVAPGNWWSVGREALAMLGNLDPPEADFREQLDREIERVIGDADASAEDRRWAEEYGFTKPPRSFAAVRLR
jgi:hypothetical protein